MESCKAAEIQGCRDAEMQRCKAAKMQRCKDAEMDSRTHGSTKIQTSEKDETPPPPAVLDKNSTTLQCSLTAICSFYSRYISSIQVGGAPLTPDSVTFVN